jgi:predicted  nucleic acid-binding Zn-ribbon protein
MFERVMAAEARMAQLQVDLATGRHNAAGLENRLAKIETMIGELQSAPPTSSSDDIRLDELESATQLITEKRELLEKWTQQLDVREAELRKQSEQLQIERERLHQELDYRRTRLDDTEATLRRQMETLADDQARFASERYAWEEQRRQALQETVAHASGGNTVDVAALTERLTRWEEKLDAMAQELVRRQSELDGLQQELQCERDQWLVEKQELTTAANERQQQLTATIHQRDTELAHVRQELEHRMLELGNLRAAAEADQLELEELSRRNVAETAAHQATLESVAQLRSRISELEQELEQAHTESTRAQHESTTREETLQVQIATLEQRLQNLEAARESLQEQLEHAQQLAAQPDDSAGTAALEEQRQRTAELQLQLEQQQLEFQRERAEWTSEQEQWNVRYAESTQREMLVQQTVAQYEQSVRDQEARIAALQAEIDTTRDAHVTASQEQLAAMETEYSQTRQDYEARITELQAQLDAQQAELAEQRQELAEQQAAWDAERAQLDATLAEHSDRDASVQQSLIEYQQTSGVQADEIAELQAQLAELRQVYAEERAAWDVERAELTATPPAAHIEPAAATELNVANYDPTECGDSVDDSSSDDSQATHTNTWADVDEVERTMIVSTDESSWSNSDAFDPSIFARGSKEETVKHPAFEAADEPEQAEQELDQFEQDRTATDQEEHPESNQELSDEVQSLLEAIHSNFGALDSSEKADDFEREEKTVMFDDESGPTITTSRTMVFGDGNSPFTESIRGATSMSSKTTDSSLEPVWEVDSFEDDPSVDDEVNVDGANDEAPNNDDDANNDEAGLPAWFTDDEPAAEKSSRIIADDDLDSHPADRPFESDDEEEAEQDDSAAFLAQLLKQSRATDDDDDNESEDNRRSASDEEAGDTLSFNDNPEDRYSPLGHAGSEDQDENEAVIEAVVAAPVARATKPRSQEGQGEEDSIEEYMNQLLARVGSGKPYSPPATPAPKPVAPTAPAVDATPVYEEPEPDKLQPHEFVPRSQAPEQNNNSLRAMRELANQSARSAIHRHQKSLSVLSVLSGLTTSILVLLVGAIFVVLGMGPQRMLLLPGLATVGAAIYLAVKGVLSAVAVHKQQLEREAQEEDDDDLSNPT